MCYVPWCSEWSGATPTLHVCYKLWLQSATMRACVKLRLIADISSWDGNLLWTRSWVASADSRSRYDASWRRLFSFFAWIRCCVAAGVEPGPHTISRACAAEDAAWLLAVSCTSNLVTIISRYAVQVKPLWRLFSISDKL